MNIDEAHPLKPWLPNIPGHQNRDGVLIHTTDMQDRLDAQVRRIVRDLERIQNEELLPTDSVQGSEQFDLQSTDEWTG